MVMGTSCGYGDVLWCIISPLPEITKFSKKHFILSEVYTDEDCILHGPSMFAIKAKIYEVLYKQSSSIAFDETSSYWSAPKNS